MGQNLPASCTGPPYSTTPNSLSTVPALVERMQQSKAGAVGDLEVYVFGPAEGALADPKRLEFNAQIDNLLRLGARVTACIGLAQKFGSESAFRARGIAPEAAALAVPRFAIEQATVITF